MALPRGNDVLASLVVFLVALPLCMGVAIASGAPPALGLITGIVGGVVVGAIAGSPLQVSGPAAGMAVLVFDLVQSQGLAMLGVVGLLAGAIQLAAGVLKLGRWFRAISPSVIHGMLAGIGVLIFASQFHVMVDDSPRSGGLANLLSIPVAIQKAVAAEMDMTHHLAALIGVATIATILGWNRFKPKALRMLPGPLLGVLVGAGLAALLRLPIKRVEVPSSLAETLNTPQLDALLGGVMNPEILALGAIFAFVASAETLLCATAVDQMHTGPRTQYDQELRAQGVGNLLCGAVGALPMTGVIVRSSANVQAGATTRWSAILHGVWLLLTVAALPWLLNHIPTSALAAILVYTGYKLVNVAQIKKIKKFGWSEIAIYAATLIGVVAVDLLTGVIAGFVLATLKLVYTFSHLEIKVEQDEGGARTDMYLEGAATFLSIPQLSSVLDQVRPDSELHIHVEHLDYIDHACLDMLAAWEKQHNATGGTLFIEWRELTDRYQRRAEEPRDLPVGSPDAQPPRPRLRPAE
jgi:MFS superfamily sulfate permease-like transporter